MTRFVLDKSLHAKSKGIHNGNGQSTLLRKNILITKLIEFCQRTDLHGCKYIVMKDFTTFERSCWAFAVLFSILVAVWFVIMAYQWYARNPILTVIESTQGAIWDVPFPAVTICDLNIISRKAAQNFTQTLKILPENVTKDFVFKTLKYIPMMFTSFPPEFEQRDQLKQLQSVLELNNVTMDVLFRQLSPASECINLVQRCMWKNTIYPCEEMFTPIFTLLGQCCTFNYYAVEEMIVIPKKNAFQLIEKPRRVASCGYQTALTVLVNTNLDDYYSTTVASQGAMVMLDNAYNIPDLDSPVRVISPSTEVLIALSPERTYATEGIKNFLPQQRQCYYNYERPINGLRQYSFHNCMAYEKVRILLKECDCVPLHFPMRESHRTCNFKDLDCMDRNLKDMEFKNGSTSDRMGSECLPECEHYDYPLEVALGRLAHRNNVLNLSLFDDVSIKNHSILNVFFSDLVSTRYRRDVYLNWQNILAAFGGLLGLMLGFTLIAGFDLVLFFVFHVAFDVLIGLSTNNMKNNKINVKEKSLWKEKPVPRVPKENNLRQSDIYHGYKKY